MVSYLSGRLPMGEEGDQNTAAQRQLQISHTYLNDVAKIKVCVCVCVHACAYIRVCKNVQTTILCAAAMRT